MRVQVRKVGVKRLIRDEKGYILIAALLVLVVVGLISGPVLSYMVSGLRAGHVFETGAAELYAADAGVTYGLWEIKDSDICPGNLIVSKIYNIDLNDKDVQVTIEYEGGPYKITSNATTGSNSHTTVVSYVNVTFMSFLDNAITSSGDVRIYDDVNGTVQYGGDIFGEENVSGETINEVYPKWPSMDALRIYYNVTSLPDFADDQINLEDCPIIDGYPTVPALRHDGDLAIDNSDGERTAKLGGTVYVMGNLALESPGNDDYVIDLNGYTILVEGSITFPANGASISGSGCIIAGGTITFLPGTASDPGDFVLLLSLAGDVTFLPSSGTFYGSIAGTSVESDISVKVDIVWQPLPEEGLDFPIDGYEMVRTATIGTWEVTRQ
jgi:Tfp pilus assembly protein PilX